jgi:hypothetical protein
VGLTIRFWRQQLARVIPASMKLASVVSIETYLSSLFCDSTNIPLFRSSSYRHDLRRRNWWPYWTYTCLQLSNCLAEGMVDGVRLGSTKMHSPHDGDRYLLWWLLDC